MKFEEIPVYLAIDEHYKLLQATKGGYPRSSQWTIRTPKRKVLADALYALIPSEYKNLIPYNEDEFLNMWDLYGKSCGKKTGSNAALLMECVKKRSHFTCQYVGRFGNECSKLVSLDRIRPGKDGGEYAFNNCIICCSKCNSTKQGRPLASVIR